MNDILSEGTGRYRRNTIIVAFVLLLIWLVPTTDFSGAGFFGVKIATNDRKAELWVLAVLFLVLLYQSGLFILYSYWEFLEWYSRHNVPIWAIGLLFDMGLNPKRFIPTNWSLIVIQGNRKGVLELKYAINNGPTVKGILKIDRLKMDRIRKGVFVFVFLDLFIPVALTVWALILTMWRITSLIGCL